jgi:hypothetical protein
MFPPKEFSTSFIVTSFPLIRLQEKVLADTSFNLQDIEFSGAVKCVYDTECEGSGWGRFTGSLAEN